ncbi:kinase-like domain-containing protein [Gongronella butleri]|nr:kinase-like domain-containing protein [Gongronella butleri]
MPFTAMQSLKSWRRRSDSKLAETHLQDSNKAKKASPPKDDLAPSPDASLYGISDYQFIGTLGQGKFSKVMLAQHYVTLEKFAIKMIDKRAYNDHTMTRLIREIAVMEALHHPNIVHLYETLETEHTIYLVMEYVEGMNLEEYMKKHGSKLSEDDARMIFRQMVSTIDYCHRRWVVHRDIKAPNILLTKDKQVRLIDFGLSNRFGLERLQTSCGSMMYYSPEIINRKRYIGPEIDCWCLGICLYRMAAGFEAFRHARDRSELRQYITQRNYNMPSHFSEGLKATIQKCLSTDRRRRSSLCNALQDDAWLNNYGQLPDLFSNTTNFHASLYQFALPSNMTMDNAFLEARQREREQQQRQYLRDMEEEKRMGYQARKTIFHHAYNASCYYTAHNYREDKAFLEPRRAALYKDILSILEQIALQSANPSLLTSISDFYRARDEPDLSLFTFEREQQQLQLQQQQQQQQQQLDRVIQQSQQQSPPPTPHHRQAFLKHLLPSRPSSPALDKDFSLAMTQPAAAPRPGPPPPADSRRSSVSTLSSAVVAAAPPPPSPAESPIPRLKKKSSKMNLWLQRSKDKSHYFTMQANVRAVSSATLFSMASSSTAVSTLRDDHQVPVAIDHEQDELELILLVRSTCELLGITYVHASRSQLCCMMTLVEPEHPAEDEDNHEAHGNNGLQPQRSTPNLLRKKKSFASHHSLQDSTFLGDFMQPSSSQYHLNNDLLADDNSASHWWHRPFQRISLPQSLRHSSSMQSLRSLYTKQHQPSTISKTSGTAASDQQGTTAANTGTNPPAAVSTVYFSVQVDAVASKNSGDVRLLALRFSKVAGSAKVYKLVTGWILRILQSNQK